MKYEMKTQIYDGGVYCLRDPDTNEIRYIGHSKNLASRKKDHTQRESQLHYYSQGERSAYLVWELSLKKPPIFEILLHCEESMLIKWEYFFMGVLAGLESNLLNSEAMRYWVWDHLLKEGKNDKKKSKRASRNTRKKNDASKRKSKSTRK